MTPRWGWLLLPIVVGGVASCGPPRVASPVNSLTGAKFDIPVYPGAKIVASRPPTTFHRGDPGSSTAYEGYQWSLSFSDPTEKVVMFYDSRIREARRLSAGTAENDSPDESNDPVEEIVALYRYKPARALDDEEVTIEIYDRRIEIVQVLRKE